MYDKSEVQFEHPAKGPHHCSQCVHYYGHGMCEIVKGKVEPQDWCKKFESKK